LRRNIFLHFLNRDTREVFGVYNALPVEEHTRLLRRALNAAALMCEEHCFAPPGFIVEDQIVFELAENQRGYLSEGLIRLPMREDNLADFAEKKRIGYEPMRNRYSGLFDDDRISFLGRHSTGIVNRKTHITEGIISGWASGAEAGKRIWLPTKKLLTAQLIDKVSEIPATLDERGMAVTWSAILPELPPEAAAVAMSPLRNTLQHVYFGQYCLEFRLIALTGIPLILHHFSLPSEFSYDFRKFGLFLDCFGLREILFDAPAELILELRKHPGFIAWVDAFVELAKQSKSETYLKFYIGQARNNVKYPWESFQQRRQSFYDLSFLEIKELADVLEEVAVYLTLVHGLPSRGGENPQVDGQGNREIVMTAEPDLILFVALEEELNVICDSLGLKKLNDTPEAAGRIGDVDVGVICPRSMGRVPAAVAMTSYLARRRTKPKLILVVGLAGGFPENKSVQGHIIVVTKVVDLALRKVVDDADKPSPNFRREDYKLHEQLMRQILSDDLNKDDWAHQACKSLKWPSDRRPSIHIGAMASADEVVASDNWRDQILKGQGGDSRLLGVEMEAGGICEAARHFNIPVSMLRVVSDTADPSKADDKWRVLGMETLADLLKNLPLSKVIKAID